MNDVVKTTRNRPRGIGFGSVRKRCQFFFD